MSRIAQDLDQLGHRPLPWARSIPKRSATSSAQPLRPRVSRWWPPRVGSHSLTGTLNPVFGRLMTDDGNGTGLQAARSRFDGGSELPFSKEAILLNRNASRYGVRISSE